MASSRKATIFKLKEKAARHYDSKCFVCQSRFRRGFTFHHLWYENNQKTYRDFKNGDDYNEYVVKIVEKKPDQFLLLCVKHHFAVETLKRFKKENFERLVKAVRMSQS